MSSQLDYINVNYVGSMHMPIHIYQAHSHHPNTLRLIHSAIQLYGMHILLAL